MENLAFKCVHNCGRELPITSIFGAVNNQIVVTVGNCKFCVDEKGLEAYEDGYAQGMCIGEEKGYEEGFAEGKETLDEPTDEYGGVIKEPVVIEWSTPESIGV